MQRLLSGIAGGLLMGLALAAPAAEPVIVSDPWVRATAPGQKVAGAYMELMSAAGGALLAAASPVAGTVELHTMKMDGGVMQMRAVEKIELPAGKSVKLAPGGLHVMLMDLKQQLRKGDTVPLTLTLQGKGGAKATLEVKAQVREMQGSEHRGH